MTILSFARAFGMCWDISTRKKKKMALLSNRQRHSTVALLRYFDIHKYFNMVLGGDDISCMKPSSCPVLNILRVLNSKAEAALMVGDSYLDVEAGKRASVRTCAATYGIGKLSDIIRSKPDYIIDNIPELKKIVK